MAHCRLAVVSMVSMVSMVCYLSSPYYDFEEKGG